MPSKRVEESRALRKDGRVKRSPEEIAQLVKDFDKYIDDNTIPIICEFAYQHRMSKSSMYDIPELVEPIKIAITKKEANLEKGMLAGKLPPAPTIFSLKQLGWSDRNEVKITEKIYKVIPIQEIPDGNG